MDDRIAFVLDLMDRRLQERHSVTALAAAVNLTPSHFAHLFRAEVGIPPIRFLQEARLERARVLLERTSLSVRDVMHQVGWSDPSHFSREFRRRYGSPPRDWRALSASVTAAAGRTY